MKGRTKIFGSLVIMVVLFLAKLAEAEDRLCWDENQPYEVELNILSEGTEVSLFSIEDGERKLLVAHECRAPEDVRVGEKTLAFRCLRPLNWDEGYEVWILEDHNQNTLEAHVYRLHFSGQTKIALLPCTEPS